MDLCRWIYFTGLTNWLQQCWICSLSLSSLSSHYSALTLVMWHMGNTMCQKGGILDMCTFCFCVYFIQQMQQMKISFSIHTTPWFPAVKITERAASVYANHCRKFPEPTEEPAINQSNTKIQQRPSRYTEPSPSHLQLPEELRSNAGQWPRRRWRTPAAQLRNSAGQWPRRRWWSTSSSAISLASWGAAQNQWPKTQTGFNQDIYDHQEIRGTVQASIMPKENTQVDYISFTTHKETNNLNSWTIALNSQNSTNCQVCRRTPITLWLLPYFKSSHEPSVCPKPTTTERLPNLNHGQALFHVSTSKMFTWWRKQQQFPLPFSTPFLSFPPPSKKHLDKICRNPCSKLQSHINIWIDNEDLATRYCRRHVPAFTSNTCNKVEEFTESCCTQLRSGHITKTSLSSMGQNIACLFKYNSISWHEITKHVTCNLYLPHLTLISYFFSLF